MNNYPIIIRDSFIKPLFSDAVINRQSGFPMVLVVVFDFFLNQKGAEHHVEELDRRLCRYHWMVGFWMGFCLWRAHEGWLVGERLHGFLGLEMGSMDGPIWVGHQPDPKSPPCRLVGNPLNGGWWWLFSREFPNPQTTSIEDSGLGIDSNLPQIVVIKGPWTSFPS